MEKNQRGGSRPGAGRKGGNCKKTLAIRLSDEAFLAIEKLVEKHKITKTEAIEMALKMTLNL